MQGREGRGRVNRVTQNRLELARERLLHQAGYRIADISQALDTCRTIQASPELYEARDRINAARVVLDLLPKSNLNTGPKVIKHVIATPEWMKGMGGQKALP